MSRQGPERERSVSIAALRHRFLGDHLQCLGLLHVRIESRACLPRCHVDPFGIRNWP